MTEEETKECIKKLEKDINEYKEALFSMEDNCRIHLNTIRDLRADNTRLIKIIDKLVEDK